MPKVSFILPAYKSQFLREAIASILAQTYRDFELIVVDDCSPQGLKSIVDEFNDPRLTYNRNETNIGGKDLVAAWNKALSYAYVQVAYTILASRDTEDREYKSLEAVTGDYYPRYVVTTDKLLQSRNGIAHVNLIDFITQEKEF